MSSYTLLDELGFPLLDEDGLELLEEGWVPCTLLDEPGFPLLDEDGLELLEEGCVPDTLLGDPVIEFAAVCVPVTTLGRRVAAVTEIKQSTGISVVVFTLSAKSGTQSFGTVVRGL